MQNMGKVGRIGMLGGGQLGRMSILAGRALGFRFTVLEPKRGSAAGMVADREICADYADADALMELAAAVDRITLEFENIPVEALRAVAARVPVHPGEQALWIAQNREREKAFLSDNAIPCAPYRVVQTADELAAAAVALGYPFVLKTADFGYDGKGQLKIAQAGDWAALWADFGAPRAVAEQWMQFDAEYSVIVVRSEDGDCRNYAPVRNVHRNHILHTSTWPSGLDGNVEAQAGAIARDIACKLELVGVLAVEFFHAGGHWWVNEIAPRPHNSGHLTIDAAYSSQFEQHIRVVAGYPLGSTQLHTPACMVNLLGDLWARGEPDWRVLLENPRVKLHLYDKGAARPGRKMGHFTVLADTVTQAQAEAEALFARLETAAQ